MFVHVAQDRTSQLVDFQAKHASTIRADLLHDIQTRLQAGGGQLPMAPTEPVHAPETTTMPTTSAAPPTAMAKGTVMTRKRGGILAAAAANAAVKQSGPMSTPTTRGSSARLPKHGEVFYSENGSCCSVVGSSRMWWACWSGNSSGGMLHMHK